MTGKVRSQRRHRTLWSQAVTADERMMRYTVGDDPHWDTRLLTWDVLGSLGHVEGVYAGGVIHRQEHRALVSALREALQAVRRGGLSIEATDEDVHSAVERWLTTRHGDVGERVHTGRSRNDQVAVDVRLFVKDAVLRIHGAALSLAEGLLEFAARHRETLMPGFTHQRRAMPSSVGAWAGGLAEGVLTSAAAVHGLWPRLDRCPLGTAAGYGVPLPLDREATARALGFAGLDLIVTSVQLGRGKLEAAVLAWCADLAHDLGRLATDVIAFTAEEYGLMTLPASLATGSSIMPHKRNPDVFELTRARAAAVDGALVTVLQLKRALGGGYHRDFQLLKEPLLRGLEHTSAMLDMMAYAIPKLVVNEEPCLDAIDRGTLVTDEVMRRVEAGVPFRRAYREVAEAHRDGVTLPRPTPREILLRRGSTGGLGNLRLDVLRRQAAVERRWAGRETRRFERAIGLLAGKAP